MILNYVEVAAIVITAGVGVGTLMYLREKTIQDRISAVMSHSTETRQMCVSRDDVKTMIDPIRHDVSELRHNQDTFSNRMEAFGRRLDEMFKILIEINKKS